MQIFKENKVIVFVGGHYQNRGHLIDHAEVSYIKDLKKKYPDYAFLLKPHPSFDAFDKTKYVLDNIPGVEVINANQGDKVNNMASIYAENYELIKFSGSDNHVASKNKRLAGISTEEPITSMEDFIDKVLNRKINIFVTAVEN